MRKISEKEMANAKGGGKFWDTIWQCEPLSGSVLCKCRKVYHRFGVRIMAAGIWA